MISIWDKLTKLNPALIHLMQVWFLSTFVVIQALLLNGSLPEDEQDRPLALCEPGVNPEEQLVSSFSCDWTTDNLLYVFDFRLAFDSVVHTVLKCSLP